MTVTNLGVVYNSRKCHLHLTFKASWNNCNTFKKCEFILIAMFLLPSLLLKLTIDFN